MPANAAPHEAVNDPPKGHMRVRRARKQGLNLCTALLEGLCRPAQVRPCGWPRKWAPGFLGATGGRVSLVKGLRGVGLRHVPLPLLQHPIPPSSTTTSPLSSALTPRPPARLSPRLSLFFSSSASPCAPAAGQWSRRLTPFPLDSASELSLMVVVLVVVVVVELELLLPASIAPCGTMKTKNKKIFMSNICEVNFNHLMLTNILKITSRRR